MISYIEGKAMIVNYQTGKEFFEDNATFINSDELRNQFFLVNAKQAWDIKTCSDHFYLKITSGEAALYAIKNEPYPLVIAGARFLLKELAEELCHLDYAFNEIIADEVTCRVFMDEYRIIKGGSFHLKTAMSTMVFKGIGKLDGDVMVCTKEEAPFVASCIKNFHKEIWDEDITYENALNKAKDNQSGIYGYYVNGKCVSIVCLARESERYVSLGLAYTLPEERNKGHIQKLILHCAQLIAGRGKTAHLHVDRANPISNHAYLKIGFAYAYDEFCYLYTLKEKLQ